MTTTIIFIDGGVVSLASGEHGAPLTVPLGENWVTDHRDHAYVGLAGDFVILDEKRTQVLGKDIGRPEITEINFTPPEKRG